jgi:toxin ParE1/3/4
VTFTVEFDPGAEQEMLEAFIWYEDRSEGLGSEFLRQVKIQSARLSRAPLIHALDYENIRRAFVGKFPYSLHFRIEEQRVRVLACVHHRRDPQSWPGA